jgi:predicted transposase YdaD
VASEQHTKMADAQDLINKGREEKEVEFILEMHKAGLTVTQIAKISKKSEHEILKVIESQLNK